MKQKNLLTRMLLLCALIVGSVSSAWAEDTYTHLFNSSDNCFREVNSEGTTVTQKKTWDDVEWTAIISGEVKSGKKFNVQGNNFGSSNDPIWRMQIGSSNSNLTLEMSATFEKKIKSVAVTAYYTGNTEGSSINIDVAGTSMGVTSLSKKTHATATATTFNLESAKSGKVTITLSDGAYQAVYVKDLIITFEDESVITSPIATIGDLTPTSININASGTFTLPITIATADPALVNGENYEITWESSDDDVLYVDGGEYLAGNAAGSVTVTVTVTPLGDETYDEVSKVFTVTIVDPKPKHNVTFSINGIAGEPVEVEEDATIKFPEVTVPEGYTFLGWTTAEISGEQTSAPTDLLNEATMGTADITYYAVFAVVSGTPATLTKMVSGDTFSAGDNVVIVANVDDKTAYALYQETQNSSYVKNYSFTANAETVGADDKNWLTVSAGSDGKWILGDATNGYLYNSGSNNLSIDINNSTNWTLEGNEDGTFKLKGSRYLSCRSDLSGANQYLFRMAGTTPAGVYNFDIYKFVAGTATYSNYCTTVPTGVTVTIASSGYTTLSSAHALDFSSTVEDLDGAYVVSGLTGTKALFTKISKAVPARTGLVLQGTAGATVTIPIAASAVALTEKNFLKECVNGGNVEGSTTYAMSGGKFKLYTGTELPVGKAYLLKSDVEAASNGEGAAPELSFDFGGDTTGIESLAPTLSQGAGVYYDLSGRRVAQPTKGLYILNGKKVILK